MKISLHIIILVVRCCFDRTHDLNKLFLHLMRALLMLNYDGPSRIFQCVLLTRNHVIFLVQFGINKHLLIFQIPQIALALRAIIEKAPSDHLCLLCKSRKGASVTTDHVYATF